MKRRPSARSSTQNLLAALFGRKHAKLATLLITVILACLGWWLENKTPRSLPSGTLNHSSESGEESSPSRVNGRVVKVSDGDTVTLLLDGRRQLKVRLLGIDAPEKSQPFGSFCRERLAEKIAGKYVDVEIAETDRYGRSIGKVLIAPSSDQPAMDINLDQVRIGCAWHYKQFQRNQLPQDRELYAEAEISARRDRKGLWRDGNPEAPWAYRREERRQRSTSSVR